MTIVAAIGMTMAVAAITMTAMTAMTTMGTTTADIAEATQSLQAGPTDKVTRAADAKATKDTDEITANKAIWATFSAVATAKHPCQTSSAGRMRNVTCERYAGLVSRRGRADWSRPPRGRATPPSAIPPHRR